MSTWEELNPALLDLFTRLGAREEPRIGPGSGTELVGPTAEHAERPRRMVSPRAKQTLTLAVTSVQGLDAARVLTFDAETETQTERVEANNRVVFRLTCDSLENTDAGWAWGTLERIRSRLRWTRSIQALLALNASLVGCGKAFPVANKIESRQGNRVVMDVTLLVHVTEIDPQAGEWIESVEISSEYITDVDGTNLPPALQMTNVVIPKPT
jgi:hypothetical protein